MSATQSTPLSPGEPALVTDPLGPGPLFHARGLAKAWDDRVVLDDLELPVESGTMNWIGGANGIGKTTLLRICAGLIEPDAGEVELDGLHPRRDRARYQRRVGFLSAGDRGLYARLTVSEHLELWGRLSLLPRREFRDAVTGMAERLALGELADRRLDRLSMGQRQRVRLAMALLHEPDVVFLDEPLNSLDPEGIALLLGCLRRVTERGGAVVWCSPAPSDEVEFDTTRLLEAGRLSGGVPL